MIKWFKKIKSENEKHTIKQRDNMTFGYGRCGLKEGSIMMKVWSFQIS